MGESRGGGRGRRQPSGDFELAIDALRNERPGEVPEKILIRRVTEVEFYAQVWYHGERDASERFVLTLRQFELDAEASERSGETGAA